MDVTVSVVLCLYHREESVTNCSFITPRLFVMSLLIKYLYGSVSHSFFIYLLCYCLSRAVQDHGHSRNKRLKQQRCGKLKEEICMAVQRRRLAKASV